MSSCCNLLGSAESGGGCCSDNSNAIIQPMHSAAKVSKLVGYDPKELKSIPEASIHGAGCGTLTKFAFIKECDTVVDLGSGAGIDVFLAANIVVSNVVSSSSYVESEVTSKPLFLANCLIHSASVRAPTRSVSSETMTFTLPIFCLLVSGLLINHRENE